MITESEVHKIPGERWTPADDPSSPRYRVPIKGTIDALVSKHDAFLKRIGPDGFNPVPPLTAFTTVGYRRAADPPPRVRRLQPAQAGRERLPVFRCGTPGNSSGGNDAARGQRRESHPSAPLAAGQNCRVHSGSRRTPRPAARPRPGARLAYIPLPSIESRGEGRAEVVARIRRAVIAVFGGQAADELQQLARLLSGMDLVEQGSTGPMVLLSRLVSSDRMVRRYTEPATSWATVTPVILPGYDDPRKLRKRLFFKCPPDGAALETPEQKELLARLDKRIDYLLRKAIRQAGYSDELAENAEIAWGNTGFWPGTELATRYQFPNKLRRFRRLHVRIALRDAAGNRIPLPGPICLGGGRFVGLGLFAAEPQEQGNP